MPFSTCPKCQHEISESNTTCPHCGHPIEPLIDSRTTQPAVPSHMNRLLPIGCGILALIAIILYLFGFLLTLFEQAADTFLS